MDESKIGFIWELITGVIKHLKEIDEIIAEQHKDGKISATNDGIGAVSDTDISFICVGTPSTPNGHLDLTAIHNVAGEIAKGIKCKYKRFCPFRKRFNGNN